MDFACLANLIQRPDFFAADVGRNRAELLVDEDGLVLDYPDLFRRAK